jgi:tripartite-type tricarboxylate transporter receptor subunit TctC
MALPALAQAQTQSEAPYPSRNIERKSSFHWSQYDLLGNLVDDPGGFAIHNSNAITTLAGLAAYAKANPGAVTVGTTGTGSDDHLAMLLFAKATGTQLTHVPYKGAGEVLAYQKGGTPIRLLGQMSATRSTLAPQVPTFKEQGIDIELASLRGLAAPRGLPEGVRKKLVDAVAAIAADPQFKQQAEAMYAPLRYLAPPAYAAELERTEAGFRKLWTEMPWQDAKP